MLTVIESEIFNQDAKENVTAKICLFDEPEMKELYLSELNPNDDSLDPDSEDHLIIQRLKDGRIKINGKEVSRHIADTIVNFLK